MAEEIIVGNKQSSLSPAPFLATIFAFDALIGASKARRGGPSRVPPRRATRTHGTHVHTDGRDAPEFRRIIDDAAGET